MSKYEKEEELLPTGGLTIERHLTDEIDNSYIFVKYIVCGCVFLILFYYAIIPLFTGTFNYDLEILWHYVLNIRPYLWADMGIFSAIGFSVFGACWGILITGSGMLGSSIRTPRVASKNLVSIVFCEAIGIYGLIVTILLTFKITFVKDEKAQQTLELTPTEQYYVTGSGFVIFAAGLASGISNMFAAMSIGTIGAACAIADAFNTSLFVQVIVTEIFAEAIAIFSIFVAIVIQFKSNFGGK